MSDQCLTRRGLVKYANIIGNKKFVRHQICVQNRINQSLLVARAWSMLAGFSRLQLARLPLRQASTARLRLCGGVKFASDCCLLFVQPALGQPSWQARSGQSRPLNRAYAASSAAKDAAEEQPDTSLPPGLYLVGTPIGNLEDLSIRALKILQNATVILAEDTRHSRKLLNHYGIKAQMHSFHQHNEHSKQVRVLEQLSQGASVAVISDAGMPLISDPGGGLVAAAAAAGHQVIPIPGPSAFLLALVGSGLSSSRFTFIGFLPDKAKARQLELQKLADLEHSLVFYVPPHDLLVVLREAAQALGDGRPCVVARELTKVHEEFMRCTLHEAIDKYSQTAAKGEVTLVIGGAAPADNTVTSDEVRQQVASLIASGQSTSSAAKIASKQLGVSRKQAYAVALRIQDSASLT